MSRFESLGHYVYEDGNRIGCTPEEASAELARKLNAYQMRVERFKAENARLKAECQARQAENSVLAVECDSLKAEVERLTKAGDVMANIIKGPAHGPGEWDGEWDNWQEAKKGGHP